MNEMCTRTRVAERVNQGVGIVNESCDLNKRCTHTRGKRNTASPRPLLEFDLTVHHSLPLPYGKEKIKRSSLCLSLLMSFSLPSSPLPTSRLHSHLLPASIISPVLYTHIVRKHLYPQHLHNHHIAIPLQPRTIQPWTSEWLFLSTSLSIPYESNC